MSTFNWKDAIGTLVESTENNLNLMRPGRQGTGTPGRIQTTITKLRYGDPYSAPRQEMGSLLAAVQSALTELRVEVKAARHLSRASQAEVALAGSPLPPSAQAGTPPRYPSPMPSLAVRTQPQPVSPRNAPAAAAPAAPSLPPQGPAGQALFSTTPLPSESAYLTNIVDSRMAEYSQRLESVLESMRPGRTEALERQVAAVSDRANSTAGQLASLTSELDAKLASIMKYHKEHWAALVGLPAQVDELLAHKGSTAAQLPLISQQMAELAAAQRKLATDVVGAVALAEQAAAAQSKLASDVVGAVALAEQAAAAQSKLASDVAGAVALAEQAAAAQRKMASDVAGAMASADQATAAQNKLASDVASALALAEQAAAAQSTLASDVATAKALAEQAAARQDGAAAAQPPASSAGLAPADAAKVSSLEVEVKDLFEQQDLFTSVITSNAQRLTAIEEQLQMLRAARDELAARIASVHPKTSGSSAAAEDGAANDAAETIRRSMDRFGKQLGEVMAQFAPPGSDPSFAGGVSGASPVRIGMDDAAHRMMDSQDMDGVNERLFELGVQVQNTAGDLEILQASLKLRVEQAEARAEEAMERVDALLQQLNQGGLAGSSSGGGAGGIGSLASTVVGAAKVAASAKEDAAKLQGSVQKLQKQLGSVVADLEKMAKARETSGKEVQLKEVQDKLNGRCDRLTADVKRIQLELGRMREGVRDSSGGSTGTSPAASISRAGSLAREGSLSRDPLRRSLGSVGAAAAAKPQIAFGRKTPPDPNAPVSARIRSSPPPIKPQTVQNTVAQFETLVQQPGVQAPTSGELVEPDDNDALPATLLAQSPSLDQEQAARSPLSGFSGMQQDLLDPLDLEEASTPLAPAEAESELAAVVEAAAASNATVQPDSRLCAGAAGEASYSDDEFDVADDAAGSGGSDALADEAQQIAAALSVANSAADLSGSMSAELDTGRMSASQEVEEYEGRGQTPRQPQKGSADTLQVAGAAPKPLPPQDDDDDMFDSSTLARLAPEVQLGHDDDEPPQEEALQTPAEPEPVPEPEPEQEEEQEEEEQDDSGLDRAGSSSFEHSDAPAPSSTFVTAQLELGAGLMQRYDVNHDGTLDADEFNTMLQDQAAALADSLAEQSEEPKAAVGTTTHAGMESSLAADEEGQAGDEGQDAAAEVEEELAEVVDEEMEEESEDVSPAALEQRAASASPPAAAALKKPSPAYKMPALNLAALARPPPEDQPPLAARGRAADEEDRGAVGAPKETHTQGDASPASGSVKGMKSIWEQRQAASASPPPKPVSPVAAGRRRPWEPAAPEPQPQPQPAPAPSAPQDSASPRQSASSISFGSVAGGASQQAGGAFGAANKPVSFGRRAGTTRSADSASSASTGSPAVSMSVDSSKRSYAAVAAGARGAASPPGGAAPKYSAADFGLEEEESTSRLSGGSNSLGPSDSFNLSMGDLDLPGLSGGGGGKASAGNGDSQGTLVRPQAGGMGPSLQPRMVSTPWGKQAEEEEMSESAASSPDLPLGPGIRPDSAAKSKFVRPGSAGAARLGGAATQQSAAEAGDEDEEAMSGYRPSAAAAAKGLTYDDEYVFDDNDA